MTAMKTKNKNVKVHQPMLLSDFRTDHVSKQSRRVGTRIQAEGPVEKLFESFPNSDCPKVPRSDLAWRMEPSSFRGTLARSPGKLAGAWAAGHSSLGKSKITLWTEFGVPLLRAKSGCSLQFPLQNALLIRGPWLHA
ncbi:hypothetical protein I7I51_01743 [Histoplasma capsulatum]|uniref:Uncharacterized protein n=1 Tax=Ajellomyces capsulatus TaxID=5037 RepID=A0A8A1MJ41_AJECA|nr:hypothetical protein I7I51_01743 [Histoplasma capsulatum]